MSLTKTVTKMFPTKDKVGLHLEVIDDGKVIIDSDFTQNFTPGQNVVEEITDDIIKQMQAAVNDYKILKSRYESSAYEDARKKADDNLVLE